MFCAKVTTIATLLALSLATATASRADDFYKGKTIQFIIGSSAGGGFDTQSRLIARYIGNFLPGQPNVVAQNMPGAGSVRASDYMFFNALKDGTVIGMIDPGVYNSQLLGESRIRFDTAKFTWIGRMVNNSPVLYTWYKSPIQTWQDLFTKTAIIAASGPTPRLNYVLLNTVLHTKIKTIVGYTGASDASLAMERGEVHGLSQPWPVLKLTKADWVAEKKIIPVLQTGAEVHPELPNVPRMIDLTKNDADRKLFEFFALPSRLGRSVMAPPGIPDERTKELRVAFQTMLKDAKFNEEAERTETDLAPLSGEELQALMAEGATFPKSVLDRAREITALDAKEAEKEKK
ncbi:MAG TPA: tripartite tricarboxylate transporter substrate-binding protein [Alphaproteobacteria bacterium]|nr:tripartite tricarboxylate transporter substrate-binding protein [Alphaproteobacteria bacterium]